jgi:hypothetical protein
VIDEAIGFNLCRVLRKLLDVPRGDGNPLGLFIFTINDLTATKVLS